MKAFKYFSILLVVLASSMCFVSCSDDDDDNENVNNNSIVGTWVYDDGNLTLTYVFESNNKGSFTLSRTGTSTTQHFTYEYDEKEKTLYVIFDDEDEPMRANVLMIGNKLTIGSRTYTRK